MKYLKKQLHLSLFILIALLAASCGTTEDTITVIQEGPRIDRAETEVDEEQEEFREMSVGIIDPVKNFDPLFAENLSTQRVLTLIYDGLVSLDRNGEPVPVLAREIDISDDGRTYTFTINRDYFYHDSRVFPAGIGRRIHASDVKWALERTAKRDVPSHAANLLKEVRGYENYYREQRHVYDSEKRVLQGVTGIRVTDEQTVEIELMREDPDFLKKLASPWLVIYPREAILNSEQGLKRQPVGTGPYRLNRSESNDRVVLTRFDTERELQRQNRPRINRINFVYNESESDLFSAFMNGDIHWLPEIGPNIISQVLDDDGSLASSYEDDFRAITNPATRTVTFFIYDGSEQEHTWLKSRLGLLTPEDIQLPVDISLNVDEFEIEEDAEPAEEYYITLTDDLFARALFTQLHGLIFQPESSLVFFDIRVPIRQTTFFSAVGNNVLSSWAENDTEYWLRIERNIVSLHHEHVSGVEPTTVPWLLHIRDVRVSN